MHQCKTAGSADLGAPVRLRRKSSLGRQILTLGCLVVLASWNVEAAFGRQSPELEQLRAQLTRLETRYEGRIAELEERVKELEAALAAPHGETAEETAEEPSDSRAEDSLAALRAAAREAAGVPAASTAPARPSGSTEPAEIRGSLNRLNPEISVTGNVLGIGSNRGREEFALQEFELDVQSNLDPFSKMRLTLAFEGEEVDVEEGYIAFPTLPGGLSLTAGKFRQQLGTINRQHLHALPQVDYPLALANVFGEEGLAQTGVSLRWLLPRGWASANELTLEVTDGENERLGGELFEQLSVLGHLKNYWDLSDAAYFEWGLTGLLSEDELGGDVDVFGTDFTLHWQPPRRAKYRELTWRSEALLSRRDDPFGGRLEAWGGYSYLEGLLRRNLTLGLRLDYAEDPFAPDLLTRGISPYLTWWQSEFVRLRGQLDFLDRDDEDSETRFLLQVTWAAGPHKHEAY